VLLKRAAESAAISAGFELIAETFEEFIGCLFPQPQAFYSPRKKPAVIVRTNNDLVCAPGVSPSNRNVWSAAVLQAKNEGDRIGLRECIRPLLE